MVPLRSYSSFSAFVGTWNVNGKNATEKLDAWLKVEGEHQPEIYVLWYSSHLQIERVYQRTLSHKGNGANFLLQLSGT